MSKAPATTRPSDMTHQDWLDREGTIVTLDIPDDNLQGRAGLYSGTLVRVTPMGEAILENMTRTRTSGAGVGTVSHHTRCKVWLGEVATVTWLGF